MVKFDLPLYMKALQITLSLPPESKLKNVVIRLGGFHLIMSFMGCIGHTMADSGLKELLSVIYAENSVDHILTGHAYYRAIRANILTQLALIKLILKNVNFTDAERITVKNIFDNSSRAEKSTIEENEDVKNLTLKMKAELEKVENIGKTAKLWVQFIHMVTLIKDYIQAERTGDWNTELIVIRAMLPYFYTSGHHHYVKACYVYLQQMSALEKKWIILMNIMISLKILL